MSAKQYRKKPVVIEAHQISADSEAPKNGLDMNSASHAVIAGWMLSHGFADFRVAGSKSPFGLDIHTLEGVMHAAPGDWIIRGVRGEFYPCRSDIFAETYEAVES